MVCATSCSNPLIAMPNASALSRSCIGSGRFLHFGTREEPGFRKLCLEVQSCRWTVDPICLTTLTTFGCLGTEGVAVFVLIPPHATANIRRGGMLQRNNTASNGQFVKGLHATQDTPLTVLFAKIQSILISRCLPTFLSGDDKEILSPIL